MVTPEAPVKRRKERTGGQGNDGEPAWKPAQEGIGEAHQPPRAAALAENEAGKGKQWDGNQNRHLRDAEELDGHDRQVDSGSIRTPTWRSLQ